MRNGDFSALLPGRVIRNPQTGLPFAGNIIPSSFFSAQGRALLNAFPLPTPGFAQGANNWIGNPPTFNNQRKDSIKLDFVRQLQASAGAQAHLGAERLERSRTVRRVLDDLGLSGPDAGGDVHQHALEHADQRGVIFVGHDEPVEIFRTAQLRLLSGRHDGVPVSDTGGRRHQLSVSVPGHEARSGQDSEYLAPGLHRDQQRRVSRLVERLRVPVDRQRHESLRQSLLQDRRERRAVGDERSHSAELRAGAGDGESERIVPLLRHARRRHGLFDRRTRSSVCSTTTPSSATSRTRRGRRWRTTCTRRTAGSRRGT